MCVCRWICMRVHLCIFLLHYVCMINLFISKGSPCGPLYFVKTFSIIQSRTQILWACFCYCYANPSLYCQTRFQIPSLAFLRRIGATREIRRSNTTTRRRPQPLICRRLSSRSSRRLSHMSAAIRGPCRWEEMGQKTRGKKSLALICQSICSLFVQPFFFFLLLTRKKGGMFDVKTRPLR